MNSKTSTLSTIEIQRRIQEIQNAWDPTERVRRKIAGEARRETLDTILSDCELSAA
jgi:hypothetical protein